MKTELVLLASSAAGIHASPTPKNEPRGFEGLDDTQSRNAEIVIELAKAEGVGSLGCAAAIATAMTESHLYMHANQAVPSSMGMAHDKVGSDQDSVGLFQQRAAFYTDISCTMDARCSAGLYFNDMKNVANWQSMGVAQLSQAIQRSEIPDAYKRFEGLAGNICSSAGM